MEIETFLLNPLKVLKINKMLLKIPADLVSNKKISGCVILCVKCVKIKTGPPQQHGKYKLDPPGNTEYKNWTPPVNTRPPREINYDWSLIKKLKIKYCF